jgi:hypothetical protein
MRGFASVCNATGSVTVTTVLVALCNSCARSNCQFPKPMKIPASSKTAMPASMRSRILILIFFAAVLHTGISLVETAH